MKKITFSYPHPTCGGYGCSEPGNNAGEYVLASEADAELARVKQQRDRLLLALEHVQQQVNLPGTVKRVVDSAIRKTTDTQTIETNRPDWPFEISTSGE